MTQSFEQEIEELRKRLEGRPRLRIRQKKEVGYDKISRKHREPQATKDEPTLYDCHVYAPSSEAGNLRLLGNLMIQGELHIPTYQKKTMVSDKIQIPICTEDDYQLYVSYLEAELQHHITYNRKSYRVTYKATEEEKTLQRDIIGIARYLTRGYRENPPSLKEVYHILVERYKYPKDFLAYYYQLDWLKVVLHFAGDLQVLQSNENEEVDLADVYITRK